MRGITDRAAPGKLPRDVLGLFAQRIRTSAAAGAVDGIPGGALGLPARSTRRGIGSDSLDAHHAGKVFPPLPQHGLVDVEASAAVLPLRLDDQVDVGVLLVRVERHGISVRRPELLPRENLRSREHLLRRCRRRHRKDDVVDQLHRPRENLRAPRPAVLTGNEIQMPALEQRLLTFLGHALPVVGLDLDCAFLADVGEVRGDGADVLAATGHLDHDFRGAPHRATDQLDLSAAETTRSRGTRPAATQEVQERPALSGNPEYPSTHCDSPRRSARS